MKIFDFCRDQEGCKGGEVEMMHAMHFVAFASVDISEVRIFLIFELIIKLQLQRFRIRFFRFTLELLGMW